MLTTTGHACGGILLVKHQHCCALQRVRFIHQPGCSGGEGKLERGQGSWDRAHDGFSDVVNVFSSGTMPFCACGVLRDIGGDSVIL
jgi:hypothetical protein